MALPVLTVQVAFGSNPGDAAFTWTTIHTSGGSPSYVASLNYQRGRQNELDVINAGTGRVVLHDTESVFDPGNTASAYYPNVVPLTPIRATALINGNTYNLFQHFVEGWPRTQRTVGYTQRGLTTVDGFEMLNQAGLAAKVYATELSGSRVGHVLDDAGWSVTPRQVAAGDTQMTGITFTADDDTSALSHLQSVSESEQGLLFVDGRGYLTWINRQALLLSPYTTSQLTLVDQGAGVTVTAMTPSYDKTHIVNEWRGTRQGGASSLVASDATSQTRYLRRTGSFATLLDNDADLLNNASWRLSRTKDPLNRIDAITAKPGTSTSIWDALLGIEIGERITVKETPPGFSTQQSHDYHVQNVAVNLPTDLTQSTFTFSLFPADLSQYWLAATAGFSEAGTTTRAVW